MIIKNKQIKKISGESNILRDREKNVFIGSNYEIKDPELKKIESALKEMKFKPIIANKLPSSPDKIHDNSMLLLHICRYSIFDITYPAGQLMELERSLDYDMKTFVLSHSKYVSKMPLTLMKMIRKWNRGDIFQYNTNITKFIKAALVAYSPSPKFKASEKKARYIIGIDTKKKYNNEDIFLIFSMGTLEKQIGKEKGFDEINKFNCIKILITGWDMKSIEKILEKSKLNIENWYVVAEHCVLCSPQTTINENLELKKNSDKFYEDNDTENVKNCNAIVIESILDYSRDSKKEVTFWSQGDEVAICYYLNPPMRTKNDIKELSTSSDITIDDFLKELNITYSLAGKKNSEDSIEFSIQNQEAKKLLLYAIEKTNAKLRRFLPYAIKISGENIQEKDKLQGYPKENVILTLKSKDEELKSHEEFSFNDLEYIIERALQKIEEMYPDKYWLFSQHIQPQSDICIDIFCKTKDEAIKDILENIKEIKKINKQSLVVYVSTGRETDIPMILKCYDLDYDFIAIGEQSISERLKNVGVLPFGEYLYEIIDFIKRNFTTKFKS